LTLIFRMGQGGCRCCFCPWNRPIPHLWMSATNHHSDNPRCKAKNHWRSIDSHFQNGVMTVSLSLLPIKTAITFILPNHYKITLQLLRGFSIPIINTTFIQLSTTAYLRNSFFPRLILRLNLLTFIKQCAGQSLTRFLYFFQNRESSLSWEKPIIGKLLEW